MHIFSGILIEFLPQIQLKPERKLLIGVKPDRCYSRLVDPGKFLRNLSTRRGDAAGPDVTVQLPLPLLLLPYNDVLALVYELFGFTMK